MNFIINIFNKIIKPYEIEVLEGFDDDGNTISSEIIITHILFNNFIIENRYLNFDNKVDKKAFRVHSIWRDDINYKGYKK